MISVFSLKTTHMVQEPVDGKRRVFLGGMAKGLGLLASLPVISVLGKSSCASAQQRKLGIALVGLGSYSKNNLAPALKLTKHCKLSGIVTGTPSKVAEWQAEHGIPDKNIYDYQNFDSIAGNPDIDIVYVVLPNSMHHEFTIRAAQAGKHVICEKPMSVSVSEGEEMIAACKKAGVQLSIGYRLRFEPFTQELIRLARAETFGKLKMVEADFGFRIGDPTQWRLKKDLAGGGPMMDVGIYCVQGARYVTGLEPLAVTAQQTKTDFEKFSEVEETLMWQMDFPGGIVAKSSCTYAFYLERLSGLAENGHFTLSPAYGYGPLKGNTSNGPIDLPHVNHQAAQMDAFAQCLMQNKPTTVPGEEGLRDMAVIEAVYEAMESGKKVNVRQFAG